MKISQLIELMLDKEDDIVIDDAEAPIDKTNLYAGPVGGIPEDDPINDYHISSVCAANDVICILVDGGKK